MGFVAWNWLSAELCKHGTGSTPGSANMELEIVGA